MTTKEHNKIFSVLMLVKGLVTALGGLLVALFYGGFGLFGLSAGKKEEDFILGGIFLVVGIVVAAFILVISFIEIFAGWKMFKEKSIGRTFGIIASILALMSFPFGTALGIYGLWLLFSEEGKNFYAGNNNNNFNYSPPPPNSWQ